MGEQPKKPNIYEEYQSEKADREQRSWRPYSGIVGYGNTRSRLTVKLPRATVDK